VLEHASGCSSADVDGMPWDWIGGGASVDFGTADVKVIVIARGDGSAGQINWDLG